MRDFNLYSVTLYQIQRFLAVAELSSFTKAAQRLNLAQPVVSKSVLSLEQTLGLILFLREKGSVRLTPAGQHFYTFWRTMVPMMEQNIEHAHSLQQGMLGQITVGVHNIYDIGYFFMPIVNRFRKKYPHIKLYTKCYSFPGLKRRVAAGTIDVAFTSKFEGDCIQTNESEQFGVRDVLIFPLTAVMLESNPLARQAKVTVSDLRYQRFIIHSPSKVPAYHKLITDMCMEYGFVPIEYEYVEDATSFALSLSDDNQVYVVDRAAKYEEDIPLKMFDLDGTISGVSLIWRAGAANPALELFLKECELFFKEHPDPFTEEKKPL